VVRPLRLQVILDLMQSLPNSSVGASTETMGAFHTDPTRLSFWLAGSLGEGYRTTEIGHTTLGPAIVELIEQGDTLRVSRYLLVTVDNEWTLAFTNGPLGTDLGVLPSRAARDLNILTIRATCMDAGCNSLTASIFEVFDQDATDPQLCLRSVYATDDGAQWRFGDSGDPLPFENLDAYNRTSIEKRLSPAMIRYYLQNLGVPAVDLEAVVWGHVVAAGQ